MHLYRQTIILFGVVLPIVCAAAVVGIGSAMKGKMTKSFEVKQQTYKAFEVSNREGRKIEKEVTSQREHLQRWNEQLSKETASAVATNLREISEQLPDKEIQQTAFERPNGSAGFGAGSAQPSSQIRIAFRGTYRTLQRAFLELETRMPQLQMQEFKMDPISSHASLMNFQVTYTAWEN